MKKYNYFDDEADEIEEVKKSSSKKTGKIDLSAIINKFKKIEATVHEEAEEDIEVVEKFPLLRSAVIKGLWIAGAILIAIIMAVSFSVSLNSKNKKAEQFNKDAGNVCINYIKKYGSVKWEALDEAKYGENKAKLTGVCYARQMDFNGNGRDELMLCYNSDNVYYLEVWGYHKGDFSQLYKDEANSTQKEAEGYWVSFYRKGNKYLICKNDKNNPRNLTTYTLRNGKFRKSGTASYDIASDTYSIKGKIIKDKFETIKLSCFRKSKAEITTELVSANIDAFGNISSQAIANTLSEKERKANAYYEVVRKRLEKYGQPSIKTDDDGEKYIDGVAYVKQIDFDADGNDELCMVYRTYKSMSKYDKMLEVNHKQSVEKIQRAKLKIQEMIEEEDKVTVPKLMQKTGLSRGFFYKNPEVRKAVDRALQLQAGMVDKRRKILDMAMDNRILQLEQQVAKLKRENETLRKENEAMRKALNKRDLNLIKNF